MIVDFNNHKDRKPNIPREAARLERRADELDYTSISKMLCGQELSKEDKKNIDKFNRQYDRVDGLK